MKAGTYGLKFAICGTFTEWTSDVTNYEDLEELYKKKCVWGGRYVGM
jgi:hypothetical protein